LPFTLLAPQKETTFKVVEIVTMSGEGILMELSRKDSEKPQGTHTSSVQIVIPENLPRGSYTLTTTIIANGIEKKQLGRFVVEGR
jgi:methionine-rich copper-binding protein CopC